MSRLGQAFVRGPARARALHLHGEVVPPAAATKIIPKIVNDDEAALEQVGAQ